MPANPDIHATNNPHDVAVFLRSVASVYSEDAIRLQADWGDLNAGRIWAELAKVLERAADRADKVVAKHWEKL